MKSVRLCMLTMCLFVMNASCMDDDSVVGKQSHKIQHYCPEKAIAYEKYCRNKNDHKDRKQSLEKKNGVKSGKGFDRVGSK